MFKHEDRIFREKKMLIVINYLIAILVTVTVIFVALATEQLPSWMMQFELAINCSLIATVGGVLYCLRSVYLNRCVHDRWTKSWETWYYLRPLTSMLCGVVAYILLKAGLVILDASQMSDMGNYGYYAFAFFAGLNVDKFVARIEEIGKAIFGIEKSRNAQASENGKEK